ncbi:MAG: transglycosylase domain-containing protein [Turicibacter sp.]|nr:transglycosylase domain-containing protein [Turicibacter sp.]
MHKKTALICLFLLVFSLLTYRYFATLPYPPESRVTIVDFLDREGEHFATIAYPGHRNWVSLEDISPYVIDGFIATEDHHFYGHQGFDPLGILHSAWDNLLSGSHRRGASTISQQYARNLFNSFEKTWGRKLREALYTIRLENSYNKDEILEGYLNTINFGHGAYGIYDASWFYFGKAAADLTLSEASLLVGIPKSPVYNSPLDYMENAKTRQQVVLAAMAAHGYITEEERSQNHDVHIIGKKPVAEEGYFVDAVFEELKDTVNPRKHPRLTVQTTYDPHIQQQVNASVKTHIQDPDLQTAVVVLEPATGDVLALSGGRDYEASSYNRALNSQRQIGSLIKPFLYYGALEYGFTPDTTFTSEPTTFLYGDNGYSPTNFKNSYGEAPVSMTTALAVSDNIYAVKAHTFLGMDVLPKVAKKFGIANVEPIPSSALGVNSVGILDISEAYGILSNNGKKMSRRFITEVSASGKPIYTKRVKKQKSVADPEKIEILNEMMGHVFDPAYSSYLNATGAHLSPSLSRHYSGKTGTTDTDSWIIGYTPEVLATVWVGYDEGRYLSGGYVSHYIWAEIMEGMQ